MSHANLFASLVGILSVESQRRAHPPGQVNTLARELWHAAAGDVPPPAAPKGGEPLPGLDATGVGRLHAALAERVSDTAAAMFAACGRRQP